ncbi:MAG: DNA-directed RNA polymerase subunit delta [Firmicutes bacterium]|nr:DNA-directed RNA polymerase subunit delta [Bacillota bacterium]
MLSKMSKEELEVLSYTDLAELILKESTKSLNTKDVFKKICELLEFSDEEFINKIGDFYTSLTTDKRFVFLDTNEWDLREKHPVDIVLEEDEEEEEIEEEIEEIEEEITEEENIDTAIEDDDLDDADDDLDDLVVLSEEEMEEE